MRINHINQEELDKIVRDVSPTRMVTDFTYKGREYHINFFSDDEKIGVAENDPFSNPDRTEITIRNWVNIVYPNYLDAIKVHEIVEADLRYNHGMSVEEAHMIADMYDRAFARRTMDAETCLDYEAFKEGINRLAA